MMRVMGFMALIPVTVLLTVGFFVLVVVRRVNEKGLKTFGYVVVIMLGISAFLVSSMGVYVIATGRHPLLQAISGMQGRHMQYGINPQQGQSMGYGQRSQGTRWQMPKGQMSGMQQSGYQPGTSRMGPGQMQGQTQGQTPPPMQPPTDDSSGR